MKKETKQNRRNRVLAQGEVSGHSHIVTGECKINREKEKIIIKAGENCVIKHLLEKPFVEEGLEQWTKEHEDIKLEKGDIFEIVQQKEYDPFEDVIRKVQD